MQNIFDNKEMREALKTRVDRLSESQILRLELITHIIDGGGLS